jgi:hypothetical protein
VFIVIFIFVSIFFLIFSCLFPGDLVVIEDTPTGPEFSCLETWVGQVSHRLRKGNASSLEPEDKQFLAPNCYSPQGQLKNYFDQMFHSADPNRPELKKNVHYVTMNDYICPKNESDWCLSNIGLQPIYRDTHHLAIEFAKGMLPIMVQKLSAFPTIYEKYFKNTPLDIKSTS